jgi:Tol biopolymer transport system component
VIRASLLCAIGALAMLAAGTAQAAFPGKPGLVAYSKTNTVETGAGTLDHSGGLFLNKPSRRGREPRQLTANPDDHSPSFSPDGRQILFVSEDEEGNASIYVVSSDGTGRREVTGDGLGGVDPHFFPSGRAIAFARMVDGHSHIFTIRLDGSGLRQLTFGAYDDRDPALSPNGRRIAFVSDRDPDGRRDRSDIFSMRPNGGQLRILVDGPYSEYDPDYAPNGRRLAFASNRGPGSSSIFVTRANGTEVLRLTRCRPFPPRCRSYTNPVFSPDGRHLAILGVSTHISTITVIGSRVRGVGSSVDSGGVEEEGFGSHVGAASWGPRPR